MMAGQVTKEQWKQFVQEGSLDTSRISRRIAASWYQCRKSGVDPYNGKGVLRLENEDLQKKREENKRLIEIAVPFMQKLAQMYAQSNMIILLIDRDGYVLKLVGQDRAKALATHINFTEGVKWTEKEVGTKCDRDGACDGRGDYGERPGALFPGLAKLGVFSFPDPRRDGGGAWGS
ncbi:hypothetical protein [Sinobaca sp. H24]|uniref:hypothetical protein n=1 Tax=Sinobaca sp. H24 TaxID=2923376 RepID=UPI002079A9A2|nr:hypothetical protein [Sinobaca sp. H24]